MSERDPSGDLAEIAEALDKITRYVAGRDRHAFLADEALCDAVMLQLLVIGEAVKRLPANLLERAPEIPWSRLVAMRNRIAHGYASLNWAVSWDIADLEIPRLRAALGKLQPPFSPP